MPSTLVEVSVWEVRRVHYARAPAQDGECEDGWWRRDLSIEMDPHSVTFVAVSFSAFSLDRESLIIQELT